MSYGKYQSDRSIPGIQWAVPLKVSNIPLVTPSGNFEIARIYGIDDATLIGAPEVMLEGNIMDLHRQGAIIVDTYSAHSSLAKVDADGKKIPLKIGDSFEINNHRAVVVGICKITQGFYPQPIVFTTYNQFKYFTDNTQKNVEFIIAKTASGEKIDPVLKRINAYSILNGLTSEELKWRIAKSFLKTGILINFGLSVALGIIIGFSIAGQIFYVMTLNNLKYYALIKALGGTENKISRMILVQVVLVGLLGFLLGIGATIVWGWAVQDTTLAFLFPWQLLLFTFFIVVLICLFTAGLSINKVESVDPKMLMGG